LVPTGLPAASRVLSSYSTEEETMPLGNEIGGLGRATDANFGEHSGVRWIGAIALCLIVLGLACTL
jgi:hypothetical protein